jgi:hypothetical protein
LPKVNSEALTGLQADALGTGGDEVLNVALGSGSKSLDDAFLATQRVKAAGQRLRDVKQLLRASDTQALVGIASWRKKVNYVYSNCFAQYYLLTEAWKQLLGDKLDVPRSLLASQTNRIVFAQPLALAFLFVRCQLFVGLLLRPFCQV